jgi:hypothetical protein
VSSSKPKTKTKQRCEVCNKKIRTMVFKNTGVCSGICEKRRNEEKD